MHPKMQYLTEFWVTRSETAGANIEVAIERSADGDADFVRMLFTINERNTILKFKVCPEIVGCILFLESDYLLRAFRDCLFDV